VRQSSVVARYGGDEFAILMPEGRVEQAEGLAERLRACIESDSYLAAHDVTASFGIATFPIHGPTQEEILRVADSGMYLAKHQEGNCVRTASLIAQSTHAGLERQLLEAYLGVAMKRMFSTGPEAFEHYRNYLENITQKENGAAPTLLDTVMALANAVDARDPYTRHHSQTVSQLASQIAREIGLSQAQIEEIRLGGILHDIGKIGVPDQFLKEGSRLAPEEYERVKTHTVLGAKILEPLKVRSIEGIRDIVRNHHERFDGTGYPDGLKGTKIPLGARIITVVDSFDPMVTGRAYRAERSVQEAIEELRRCAGSQFDPEIVEAFIRSLDSPSSFQFRREKPIIQ
jgi:putative nucleotidyltransferase with HDIG domain